MDAGTADAMTDAPSGMAAFVAGSSSLDFGVTDIGVAVQRQLQVTNTGTAMGVPSVTIVGDRPFSRFGCEDYVMPGQSCVMSVNYLPYTAAVHTATIVIDGAPITARGETLTTLGVTAIRGTVSGPGFDCRACVERFAGDGITLVAVADPGQTFVSWSDASCGTSPTCFVSRDAIGHVIFAYFAPSSPVTLTITRAGNGLGDVTVFDRSVPNNTSLGSCPAGCQVPISSGHSIEVIAQTPSQLIGLSGACSGSRSCTFTAGGATSITAAFQRDPKERWTRVLETNGAVNTAIDSHGNIIVLTNAFDAGTKIIKFDPDGNVMWVNPRFGREIGIGPNDSIYVGLTSGVYELDADGYLIHVFGFEVDPPVGVEDVHFKHRLEVGPDGRMTVVGAKLGQTNVQSRLYAPPMSNAWSAAHPTSSLQKIRTTGAQTYVAMLDSNDTPSLLGFTADGVQLPTVPAVAPHPTMSFEILSAGGFASASSSATQVSLRRVISTGVQVFQRDVPVQFTEAPPVGIAALSNGRMFWAYPADPDLITVARGYRAEIVGPTGNVEWSIERPPTHELYNLAARGPDLVLVGVYHSFVPRMESSAAQGVVFGGGLVQVFSP